MTKWYYVTPQKTHQEFNEDEAAGLIRTGAIRPETLIWNDSLTDWKPAKEQQPDWFGEDVAPPSGASLAPVTSAPGAGQSGPNLGGSSSSPPQMAQQSDPLAMASLICGIVSLVLLLAGCFIFPCISFLAILSAIPAVVTGHMALGKINQGTAPAEGRGLAIAGLIMGYATSLLFVIGIILAILGVGAFAALGAVAENAQRF